MSAKRVLTIALLVQIALIAILWWPRDLAASRRHPLLDLPRDGIEQIEISTRPAPGAAGAPAAAPKSVVLKKTGDGWVIASAADYPASQTRIDGLLDSLLGLVTGPPIATQHASYDALKVGDDSYGRRVAVTAAGDTSTWLIGAATSRSINVRQADDDDVYLATGASEWSFQDTPSSYWDASYVDADAATFGSLAIHNAHGDVRFEKQGNSWTLADLAEGESADSEKIAEVVALAARVRMTEPVGRESKPEYGLDDGLRVDWTIPAENQSVSSGYAVGADVDADSYVKAVDRPFVVRARKTGFQRLRDAARAEFLLPQ